MSIYRCKLFNNNKCFISSTYSKTNVIRLNNFRCSIYLQRSCNKNERSAEIANSYTWTDSEYWDNVWKERQYFLPKNNEKDHFKMILPPPNVTGVLHLGHALTCTIQDVLARWHRMRGKSVIWVPGLDHAGIATQAIVEKYLGRTKGVNRHELGKDEFLSCIGKWKEEKSNTIRNQLKAMGMSLDWSREFFTMSKEHSEAVTEAFFIMSQQGLLYRNKALVNWSTSLGSTISDMEIEHVHVTQRKDFLVPGYPKKIPFGLIAKVTLNLLDSKEHVTIATTRIETMPGDVAIAVHPEDPRYSRFIGQRVWHPIRETPIPIIGESSVQQGFGTGVVKVTPAHHHGDFDIAKRHNLDIIDVIGSDGNMTANAGRFEGLRRFEAREQILDELAEQGALKSLENHEMMVPVCSRSGDVVEYLLREQWFLRTEEMAKQAIEAVENGSLKINPPEWAQVWCDWLKINRDWCVSRQIWWGHRIPAYRNENGDWIIARSRQEALQQLLQKGNHEYADLKIEQDPDVLDTWFSSALLPLTAMGWPNPKFEKFFPLSLMETGHDIIFLWVARMVMLGMKLTNTMPFKEVLFHGVLCDAHGKKMSKSQGNAIRPEHVINGISLEELNAEAEKNAENGILSNEELKRTLVANKKMFPDGIPACGSDALRMTLCAHNIKNSRISFNVIECRTNNHFCNKIWQATKFVLRTTENCGKHVKKPEHLSNVDRWILSRLSRMVTEVNDAFENRNFYKAVSALKQFFYYEFCDFFLEATKPVFKSEQREIMESHWYSLAKCLEVSLRALAPITPYLSEDLYARCAEKLPNIFLSLPSLLEASFPKSTDDFGAPRDLELEIIFNQILDVVKAIRNALTHVAKRSDAEIHIVTDVSGSLNHFAENLNFIAAVTRIQNIRVFPSNKYESRENSVLFDIDGSECRIFLLLTSKSSIALVREKMEKKHAQYEKKMANFHRLTKSAPKSEDEVIQDHEKVRIDR
ncbi:valine--tRNA ligase, mitochondrial-like isoform X2 [Venturia canescens]|uniref:valine--tRNA ligase, mitochondrial-like isoform X2 n=1 Tax=Venturia canescens TaxID=32260 RepID=UPI001C9D4A7C|nr:valine--tRNA ligase, mitochondrial-like isoform X2 [Venturia canescens]XP_043285966.1 valine--tRNA ligase, mitochondrial-like isoform X2 [Venturia canescens]